ncbi:hypothetical protein GCM10022198_23750 [Klugiella xanthotipulae]|uniref:Uncharacterized protein n=1 Tax=Klugiella xanthotipulae TaxID=244735 RepID=A0A543I6H2_9MICO|nr:hypothetical protein [Klugiella xanthotipulae]TQM66178.1 hypothetical protein FB466_1008 [Klugiella xanthotipulae]
MTTPVESSFFVEEVRVLGVETETYEDNTEYPLATITAFTFDGEATTINTERE